MSAFGHHPRIDEHRESDADRRPARKGRAVWIHHLLILLPSLFVTVSSFYVGLALDYMPAAFQPCSLDGAEAMCHVSESPLYTFVVDAPDGRMYHVAPSIEDGHKGRVAVIKPGTYRFWWGGLYSFGWGPLAGKFREDVLRDYAEGDKLGFSRADNSKLVDSGLRFLNPEGREIIFHSNNQ